jgi:hypothetical protein
MLLSDLKWTKQNGIKSVGIVLYRSSLLSLIKTGIVFSLRPDDRKYATGLSVSDLFLNASKINSEQNKIRVNNILWLVSYFLLNVDK